MNTGLQDAANLGWKLAAVLGGRAEPALLDTYQAERHPVGRSVLRSSGGIVRLAMAKYPWTLAFRAALTSFLNHVGPARTHLAGQVTGIGYKYAAPRGAHRLVGTRVPDVALRGGRLYEALRGGRFVLITPESPESQSPESQSPESQSPESLRSAARSESYDVGDRKDRLAVESWASARRTTVLVRPDGYVAWAAEDTDATAVEVALAAAVGN